MLVMPGLRRRVFFTGDRLRGGTVAAHLRDIEAIIAAPTSPQSTSVREGYLQDLLDHAVTTVPHYRHLRSTPGSPLRLADFPVMTRRAIQDDPAALQSTSFDISSLPQVRTSGSSGTPLAVPRDPVKRKRHMADLIAFMRLAGYDFGDPVVFLSIRRAASPRWDPRGWMQAVEFVPSMEFDDDLVQRVLGAIDHHSRVAMVGFPSALEFIGRRLDEMGTSLPRDRMRSVLAMSEAMTPWLRTHGPQVYGSGILSRYSNWENGILAQQTATSQGRFIVNHGSYIVEILDDHGAAVAPGHVGRVVITDLFSRAMPLIRYDTADLARWSLNRPDQLEEVLGRKLDVLISQDGRRVAPFTVSEILIDLPGVRGFQVTQTDRLAHRVSLVAAPDPSRDATLVARMREVLGPDIDVTVEYVDDIAAMPSGKRRPVANLWVRN